MSAQEAVAWSQYHAYERRRGEQQRADEEERHRRRDEREAERRRQEREEMLARMTPAQREAFLTGERRCDSRASTVGVVILIAALFAALCFISPSTTLTPGAIAFFLAGGALVVYSMAQREPWDHRWKRRCGYLLLVVGVLTAAGVIVWFPDHASRVASMLMAADFGLRGDVEMSG
mmetsp:Transcript_74110/g.230912  ORF Transcript_74110/g.230912 Transcript_74110/m.230912 type:complete len:176 (+) Transcript_74110:2-529(+)